MIRRYAHVNAMLSLITPKQFTAEEVSGNIQPHHWNKLRYFPTDCVHLKRQLLNPKGSLKFVFQIRALLVRLLLVSGMLLCVPVINS